MAEFDPGDPVQAGFMAFGRAPFPDKRDDVLDRYVEGLRARGPQAVASAIAVVSDSARDLLQVYADRAATRAVREMSKDLLVSALVAVVVGGLDRGLYGALRSMAPIDDACKRVGVVPDLVFAAAADIVGHPGTINLAIWLSRKPEDRTLEALAFSTSRDGQDFRYVSTA